MELCRFDPYFIIQWVDSKFYCIGALCCRILGPYVWERWLSNGTLYNIWSQVKWKTIIDQTNGCKESILKNHQITKTFLQSLKINWNKSNNICNIMQWHRMQQTDCLILTFSLVSKWFRRILFYALSLP